MDPFSIASGVVGLLAVIGEVTKAVKDYATAVKDRKQDIHNLHQELLLLGGILGQLRDFLSTQQAQDAAFDDDSVLRNALVNCTTRLERVGDKLKAGHEGKLARTLDRLKWPFEQDEIKKLVDALQRSAQTFQFALTTKGLSILSKAADAAETALHEQRASFRKVMDMMREESLPTVDVQGKLAQSEKMLAVLPSILDQTGEIKEMSHHLRLQEEREQARQKAEILAWLIPASSLHRHVETQRKRISDTCEWFLHSDEFEKWQSLSEAAYDMLCTGHPGAGKTILASFVYDHFRTKYSSDDVVVLNYYCSHFEAQSQDAAHFAKSLLRQTCQSLSRMPSAVLDFYRETRHDLEDILWFQELRNVLQRVIGTCDNVFIVIDALDELEDVRRRNEILKVLQDIRSVNPRTKILATTRPHLGQLQAYFSSPCIVNIAAKSEDVELYLKQRLAEHHDLELIDDAFHHEIIDKLTSRSQGTFLLPALQLNNILQQITKADMRRALEEHTQTLDEAFKASLDRIYGLPAARRDLAFRTMMWISHAKRPLQISELQQALAVREGEESLDADNIVPSRVVIESCAGLVQLDQETSTVAFFHFSIDEYLRSQPGILPDHELPLVRTCLSYLLHSTLRTLPMLTDDLKVADFIQNHGFFRYAAYYWGFHAQDLQVDCYSDLAIKLLNSSLHILAISRLRHLDNPYAKDWRNQATPWAYSNGAGITIAAYFGLADLIELLISKLTDKTIINRCRNVYGNLPLQDAAGYGHTDACEVLIANGADLMDTNKRKSTPFYHAVTYGRLETARALLKHNRAQLDVHCRGGWTALHKAADLGDEAMLEFLLQTGALVAAVDEKYRTALHIASKRGHAGAVKLLVLAGANINASSREETSLDLCSTSGSMDVAQYLISQGADIDHVGHDGWTPLFRACRGGHVDLVKLLLKAGANLLHEDYRQNTCLFMACRAGNIDIVKALLEHRDPKLQSQLLQKRDHGHRNAQELALITAHIDIYKYLRDLEIRLDIDSSPLQYQIYNPIVPLAQAIEARDWPAAELLLKRTPELLHRADGSGHLPIHIAFIEDAAEIATLLLGLGASIHSRGFHGWQPLHIAASIGSVEMTQLALKHGADIEAKTGTSQTPLLKAAASNSVAVIRCLLEAGANIWARNERGMTCLHVAASKRFLDGIRELLQPDWNAQDLVHARDRHKNLPRDWADRTGHWEAATFLRLQEKLITNSNDGRRMSRAGNSSDHLSRTITNTSQTSLTLPIPLARTPNSFGPDEEIDRFAQMILEQDSD
ncbi:hypothetical protein PMZ80_006556 [Knufia obscura]|uniref:Uncharacterized protein n=2 Tax=Knufia TaxID=430999 RepID=A0AAN8I5B7_9EURO|nr:hypothetical protein PMZ80_006556 [Knufia obscura]KAK5950915.1 hypothetical protein OHC33_007987 [Knufia fluminis]